MHKTILYSWLSSHCAVNGTRVEHHISAYFVILALRMLANEKQFTFLCSCGKVKILQFYFVAEHCSMEEIIKKIINFGNSAARILFRLVNISHRPRSNLWPRTMFANLRFTNLILVIPPKCGNIISRVARQLVKACYNTNDMYRRLNKRPLLITISFCHVLFVIMISKA